MNVMAGYEIHIFQPDGRSGMGGPGGMGGGHMSFGNDIHFQLHYNDNQLNYYQADEESISVKYWDDESEEWITPDYNLDTQKKVVNFNSSEISNYVILTANKVTGITLKDDNSPSKFVLSQNYPNPFNPSTNIQFYVPAYSLVKLNIYNSIGEIVGELQNENLQKGSYNINWDAKGLASGVYFLKLMAQSPGINKPFISV